MSGARANKPSRLALAILLASALLACCLLLTSCQPGVTPFSRPYSFDRMQQMLHNDGKVDVAFSQVDAEVTHKLPKEVVYTCSVDGRDLQFHCTSGVYTDSFFGIPLGWFHWIKTDYTTTILELYRDQANSAAQRVFGETGSPNGRYGQYFTIHARSEIPQVVAALHAMDDVYAQEAPYHDGRWLNEPRKMFVYLEVPEPGGSDMCRIDVVSEGIALDGINGTAFDETAVSAKIQAEYQSYEDGTRKNLTASENYRLSIEQTRQLFAQADH